MRKRRNHSERLFSLPFFLGCAGVLILLGYATFALYPLAVGPTLTVSFFYDEERGLYHIAGETTRVSAVTVNGLSVPITESGLFAVERTFPPGYTVVTIRAEDRFGRSREEVLSLVNTNFRPYASKEKSDDKDDKKESSSEGGSSEGDEGGEEGGDQ